MRIKIPFSALMLANIVSMIGNVLTLVALPWFVFATTGSPAQTALTGVFEVIPVILAAFFTGAFQNWLGLKRAGVLADLGSAIFVSLIPLLYITVGLELWQLLFLVFLRSLCNTPGFTARQSLLPDVARLGEISLERANSAFQVIQRLSLMVGSPLAGFLIAILSPVNLLWLDAGSFIFSALLTASLIPASRGIERSAQGYLSQLKEGFRFIHQDKLISAILITVLFTNLLDAPVIVVLLPVYASKIFGSAQDLGLMIAALGGGSVAGAILFGWFGTRFPRREVFILAFIFAGLPNWLLASLPGFPVVLCALVFRGFASGPLNPIIMTVAQERIPVHLRGQVFSLTGAIAQAAMPLGMVGGGFLVEQMGLAETFLILAGGYLFVTAALWFNPALYEMQGKKGLGEEPEKALITS